mgnify:CR=1 FL=1
MDVACCGHRGTDDSVEYRTMSSPDAESKGTVCDGLDSSVQIGIREEGGGIQIANILEIVDYYL